MNCSVSFACSAQYWLYFHLSFSFPFLKLIFMLLVCLFLAVLGLHCCVGSALVSGHRLQAWASVALACGLGHPAARAILLGEPLPPALAWAGGFLTSDHQGSPSAAFLLAPVGSKFNFVLSPTTGIPECGLSSGSTQGSLLVTLLPILVTRMSWSLPQAPPFTSALWIVSGPRALCLPRWWVASGSFLSVLSFNRGRHCAAKWHHGSWQAVPLSRAALGLVLPGSRDGICCPHLPHEETETQWRRAWCHMAGAHGGGAQTGPLAPCPVRLGGTDGLSSR